MSLTGHNNTVHFYKSPLRICFFCILKCAVVSCNFVELLQFLASFEALFLSTAGVSSRNIDYTCSQVRKQGGLLLRLKMRRKRLDNAK